MQPGRSPTRAIRPEEATFPRLAARTAMNPGGVGNMS